MEGMDHLLLLFFLKYLSGIRVALTLTVFSAAEKNPGISFFFFGHYHFLPSAEKQVILFQLGENAC